MAIHSKNLSKSEPHIDDYLLISAMEACKN